MKPQKDGRVKSFSNIFMRSCFVRFDARWPRTDPSSGNDDARLSVAFACEQRLDQPLFPNKGRTRRPSEKPLPATIRDP